MSRASSTAASPSPSPSPVSSEAPAAVVQPTALRHRQRLRRTTGLLLCLVAAALAALASLVFGARVVSWHDVVAGVLHPDPASFAQTAVHTRVPRTVLGLVVGAALGLTGAVMQGLTRNPLADPGLLGISSGASLFVAGGIAAFGISTPGQYVWLALAGAATTAAVVHGVAAGGRRGRSATPLALALAGAVTTAGATSTLTVLLLLRTDVFDTVRFWMVGSLGRASTGGLLQVLPLLLLGAVLALLSARGLDAVGLGDDIAAALGQRLVRVRALAVLACVLLCGSAVAVSGPIGFVGLVVPHVARRFTGSEHRWLLPASAALGAAVLVAADVVGRVVSRPGDVEVGVVVGLLGGPVFIALVRRQRVRDL